MIPDESSKTFPLLWIHKNTFLKKKKKKNQKTKNKQTNKRLGNHEVESSFGTQIKIAKSLDSCQPKSKLIANCIKPLFHEALFNYIFTLVDV